MINKDPWFRNRLIRDGIYAAIRNEMAIRPEIYLFGEGANIKIHYDAPDIERDYPERVVTLPIDEDSNNSFAVGASLAGVVPIVDVISSDFLYRCMDSICNTMAKAAVVGDPRTMIVRSEFLTGGPTSGQRVEALFAHIPGLRVCVPSNPIDAYWMMSGALRHLGVTIFFEDRMIPDDGTLPQDSLVASQVRPAVGPGVVVQSASIGFPVVVTYGIGVCLCREAFADGEATIIDLRTLWPLDVGFVAAHLRGSLLVVEPDVAFLGIGAEIVAQIVESTPGVRVRRLGAPRATIPASRPLHERMLPSIEEVRRAFEELST